MNHFDELVVERLLAGKLTAGQVHKNDRDAAILHLHQVEGLPVGEIAGRLATNRSVVVGVLARDVERLARLERLAAWTARVS